jgi:RsiW-degrading membrane proteinase PrsW (M82 family)
MKPLPTAIFAALVVALAVLGYFYYQRTNEDITIRIPKIEIKP